MKINSNLNTMETMAIAMYESHVRFRDYVEKDREWYELTTAERNIWRDRALDMASEINTHYGK